MSIQDKSVNIDFHKILHYKDFMNMINFSNQIIVTKPECPVQYKAYIGKGNNGSLVRGILYRRWWWVIAEKYDYAEINMVWMDCP